MSSQEMDEAEIQQSAGTSATVAGKKRKVDEADVASLTESQGDEETPAAPGVTKEKGRATADLHHAIRSSEDDIIASMKRWGINYSKNATLALTHLVNLVLVLCGIDELSKLKASMVVQEAHIDISNQNLSDKRLEDLPGEENHDADEYNDLQRIVDVAIRTWAQTCKEKWLMDPSLAGKDNTKTTTPPAPLMIRLCTSLMQGNCQMTSSSTAKIAALDKSIMAFEAAVRASPHWDSPDWQTQDQRRLFLLSLMPFDDAMNANMKISTSMANILHDMFVRVAKGKKVELGRLTGISDNGRYIRGLIWGVLKMVKLVRTALGEPTLAYFTTADVNRCRTAVKLLWIVDKKIKDDELLLKMFLSDNLNLDHQETGVLSIFLQQSYHAVWKDDGAVEETKRLSMRTRFAASRTDLVNTCGTNTDVTVAVFSILQDLPLTLLVNNDPKTFGNFADVCIAQLKRTYTSSCAAAVSKAFATWEAAMYSVVGPDKQPSPTQQNINIAHAYNTLHSKVRGLVKAGEVMYLKLGKEVCESQAVQLINAIESLATILSNVAVGDQGLGHEEYVKVFGTTAQVLDRFIKEDEEKEQDLEKIVPCCLSLMKATIHGDVTSTTQSTQGAQATQANRNGWINEMCKHIMPILTSSYMPTDVVLEGFRTWMDIALIMSASTPPTLTTDNEDEIIFNDGLMNLLARQVKNAVVELMLSVTTRAGVIEKVMHKDEDSTGRDSYLEVAEFQIYQECAGGSAAHLIDAVIAGVQARLIGLEPATTMLAHAMPLQYHFQKPLADLLNSVHLYTFNSTLTTDKRVDALEDLIELASTSLPQSFESEVRGARSHRGTKRLAAMWSKALKENAFNPLTASGYTDENLSTLYTNLIKAALPKKTRETEVPSAKDWDLFWDTLKVLPIPKNPTRKLLTRMDMLSKLDPMASPGSAEYVAFFVQSQTVPATAEQQTILDKVDECNALIQDLRRQRSKFDPKRKHDDQKRQEVDQDIAHIIREKRTFVQKLPPHLQGEVESSDIQEEEEEDVEMEEL
ncbi:hypothetical protein KI688_008248 [Linnemannia hyalina]|uniref:Uncharacterized protein n=1 Tax=Linnemannia hyalina TaxID=64524 RepID=A0A9P7Y398_9FUNG|nr:hypothetical protein KI688_008248 [Linnemannia hyalina]